MQTRPTSLLLAFALATAPAMYAAGPKPAVAPKAAQAAAAPAIAQAPYTIVAPAAPQAATALSIAQAPYTIIPDPQTALAPLPAMTLRDFQIITPDAFDPIEFAAPFTEAFDMASMADAFKVAPMPELAELRELPMFAYAQQGDSKPDKSPSGTDPVYDSGLKAMDEARWSDAVKQFDKVAGGKSDRMEAALYWKAYSLEKLSRGDDASAACEKLKSERPNSRWNRDCSVLRMQNGQKVIMFDRGDMDARLVDAQARANEAMERTKVYRIDARAYADDGKPRDPNDEIKLIALNSVLQQKPAEAIPVLKSYILSDRPVSERRRALFMLSRSKAPEAQALLTEIANNKTDPSLQRVAVQTMATGRGKQAGPDLLSIYRNSSDKDVKRAAVSGLFIAGDATDLVDLARNEKDLNMKREIVTQLALMHDPAATAYMEELLK